MKALIAYYSDTGNTEKVARAISDAVDFDMQVRKISDVTDWKGYDIIFFGFPVHAHSVPAKAAQQIAKIPKGQKIAFFSTHGSLRNGILPKQAFEHALGLSAKLMVLGHFGCRGKVDGQIIESLQKNPQHKAWVEEAAGAIRHPDENDLADAKAFGAQMVAKVKA
jgi:flavodoxin I